MKSDAPLSVLLRGTVISAVLTLPAVAALSALFTIDDGDARVRQWNPDTGAFIGDPALLTEGGLQISDCSDIEWDGDFYYGIRAGDPRVMRFDSEGHFIDDVALLTDELGPIPLQTGLAYDGSYLYSIAPNDARIRQYTLAGQFLGDYANFGDSFGPVTSAVGFAKDNEYFYTIESGGSVVRKFGLDGQYISELVNLSDSGGTFSNNTGIAIAPIPEATTSSLMLCTFASFLMLRRRCAS